MRPLFFHSRNLEHETNSDRHELIYAPVLCATRDAVITRLYECCEGTEAECCPEPGVRAKVVLRLGTGHIGLRVVKPTTSKDVGFSARSRKGIDEFHQCR